MNEYTLAEFSIFYKRLITVENCLKTLIITQYTSVFVDRAYDVLYRYFHNLDIRRNAREQIFKNIRETNKNNSEKLITSVNRMYLGEILNLFANPVFLKNKKVTKIFFPIFTETNNSEFQQKAKALNDFRNCIAHGNEKKFYLERKRLINGLVFFEKILQCNIVLTSDLLDKISSFRKMSVCEILSLIYITDKHYFKDDKLLIILFDDIALINGYIFKSLPQRWSIIRQKFELEKQIKENIQIKSCLTENSQMRFDFE